MGQIGNISLAFAALGVHSFFAWKLFILYHKKGLKNLKWDEWAFFFLAGMSVAAYNHFFEDIFAEVTGTMDWIARIGSAILLLTIYVIIYFRSKATVHNYSEKADFGSI